MTTASKPHTEDQQDRQWYLRIDGERVFGPKPLDDLIDWARQGRIAPGHEVSDDKRAWIRAEQLPALGMTWMVELPDGSFYGPLNGQAVLELANEETVTPDAMMINQSSNARTTVQEFRELPPEPGPDSLESTAAVQVRAAAPASASTSAASQAEIQTLRKQIEEESQRIKNQIAEQEAKEAQWKQMIEVLEKEKADLTTKLAEQENRPPPRARR